MKTTGRRRSGYILDLSLPLSEETPMKYFLLMICALGSALAQTARNPLEEMTERLATPEPLPYGPALMEQVQANLPQMPLLLTGEIRTRREEGRSTRRLISELRFGDLPPKLSFELADAFGSPMESFRVEWRENTPVWIQEDTSIETPEELADTGLNGADLALEFLWWPGAETTGIRRIRARDAYEVRIPSPTGNGGVRLWIDKRALFVVEAETLDENEKVLRRLQVDKLKKIREELWMVQDLVIRDYENDRTIKIRFSDVVELER